MSNRNLKVKLWHDNPNCHWCGKPTILTNVQHIKGQPDPMMATIDHIISRYSPLRWVKAKPGEMRKVLACFECNARRSAEETAKLSKEELYRRGQGFCLNPRGKPRLDRTHDSLDQVLDKLKSCGIIISNDNAIS